MPPLTTSGSRSLHVGSSRRRSCWPSGTFCAFFAVGRADSEDTPVEASGEQSEASTDHQLSSPNVRLTGSGNLPQLAAVREPPPAEKPKPTPPPAAQRRARRPPSPPSPPPSTRQCRPPPPPRPPHAGAHARPGAGPWRLPPRQGRRTARISLPFLRRLWLSDPRSSSGSMKARVVAVAVIIAAAAAPAAQAAPWKRVTTPDGASSDQVGLARTADGVLHVAWHHPTGPNTADLLHTVISRRARSAPRARCRAGGRASPTPRSSSSPAACGRSGAAFARRTPTTPRTRPTPPSRSDGGASWALQPGSVVPARRAVVREQHRRHRAR